MGEASAALTEVWDAVLRFLPRAVAFLLIVAVGVAVAVAVRRIAYRGLRRTGFDRLLRRGGLGRALARNRCEPSDLSARLVYYAVLLVTLQVAFAAWGPNPVSVLIDGILAWLPRAFVAIVLVAVASAIAGAVRDLAVAALGGLPYGRLVGRLAGWAVLALGTIAALDQVGIATSVTTPVLVTTLATVGGVIVVGVGGGLVRPMSRRWDRWLDVLAREARLIREHARAGTDSADAAATDVVARTGSATDVAAGPRVHQPVPAERREPAATTYRSAYAAGGHEADAEGDRSPVPVPVPAAAAGPAEVAGARP